MDTRKNINYQNPQQNEPTAQHSIPALPEEGLKVNGLEQVVEMLRFADPAFRESLLKRITLRDPKLAASLRRIVK